MTSTRTTFCRPDRQLWAISGALYLAEVKPHSSVVQGYPTRRDRVSRPSRFQTRTFPRLEGGLPRNGIRLWEKDLPWDVLSARIWYVLCSSLPLYDILKMYFVLRPNHGWHNQYGWLWRQFLLPSTFRKPETRAGKKSNRLTTALKVLSRE